MKEGWICPRCGKALAPWVSECACYLTKTITSNRDVIRTDKCAKVCQYKTDLGYCKFTACVMPEYGGDSNYGIGNGV